LLTGEFMKVYIGNDGCVEGQLSSTYLLRFLKANQLIIAEDPSDADLVFFYACGLTQSKEEQSKKLIFELRKSMKSTARLIVWGCLPKINPSSLRKVYDGPLIGPNDVSFFNNLIQSNLTQFDSMQISGDANRLVSCSTSGDQYADAITNTIIMFEQNWTRLWERVRKNTKFIIRVAKGCTGSCTYCSERCVFGSVRSRDLSSVISDFGVGLKQGYRLFSLMATDLGAYGKDIGYNLADLLRKIISTYREQEYQIVLNQVNPFHLRNLYSDLESIFETGRIYSLCSPVQSGSDRLLRLMRRPHTAEEWRTHMLSIRKKFPKIRLLTQFMVGFPTETEEDFHATEKLLDYPAWFDYVHIFKFSSRPHVYASLMKGQVPEDVKERRKRKLLQRYAVTRTLNILTKGVNGIF
jgi:threonylcarbamoyladenosine tRNA methylthiotransferase CDKAL1